MIVRLPPPPVTSTQSARGARVAMPAELSREQRVAMRRALTPKLNKYIPRVPHPRQAAFLLCNGVREVGFGGATRGGKSEVMLIGALQYVEVPGYAAIILRRSRTSLYGSDGLVPRSHEWLQGTDAVWNGTDHMWRFPSGASLTFGYCEGPNDVYRYQSSAYAFIGWEELCEIPRAADYEFLFSRQSRPAHGPLSKVPMRTRSTFNPVGPGFAWVRDRFIRNVDGDKERLFIRSLARDNPSIDQEDYAKQLRKLSPVLQRRLGKGDWSDIGQGEVFDTSRIHLVTADSVPRLSEFHVLVRMWDLAGTEPSETNPDPDWTRGVLVGLRKRPGKGSAPEVWLLDVRSARVGPAGVRELVRRTAEADGRSVYVCIEQEPGQSGKDQADSYKRMLAGYVFRAIRSTGSKVVRAEGLSAAVGTGDVYMVAGTEWTHAALDELGLFPYGTHDDLADAASGGYTFASTAHSLHKDRVRIGPRIT